MLALPLLDFQLHQAVSRKATPSPRRPLQRRSRNRHTIGERSLSVDLWRRTDPLDRATPVTDSAGGREGAATGALLTAFVDAQLLTFLDLLELLAEPGRLILSLESYLREP